MGTVLPQRDGARRPRKSILFTTVPSVLLLRLYNRHNTRGTSSNKGAPGPKLARPKLARARAPAGAAQAAARQGPSSRGPSWRGPSWRGPSWRGPGWRGPSWRDPSWRGPGPKLARAKLARGTTPQSKDSVREWGQSCLSVRLQSGRGG